MKKTITVLTVILAFAIFSCGERAEKEEEQEQEPELNFDMRLMGGR